MEASEIAMRPKSADAWVELFGQLKPKVKAYGNMLRDKQKQLGQFTEWCAANILPMPVYLSPLVVAIDCIVNQDVQSCPLYRSAFDVLISLSMMRNFMASVAYSASKQPELLAQAQKLDQVVTEELGKAQVTLRARLDRECYQPRAARQMDEVTMVRNFVVALEEHTLYMINRLELHIYSLMAIDKGADAAKLKVQPEHVLTPRCADGGLPTGAHMMHMDPEGRNWKLLIDTMERMLKTRTALVNARQRQEAEETGRPIPQPIQLFDADNLILRVNQALIAQQKDPTNTQLYAGWLLFSTAREYCRVTNRSISDDELRQIQGVLR